MNESITSRYASYIEGDYTDSDIINEFESYTEDEHADRATIDNLKFYTKDFIANNCYLELCECLTEVDFRPYTRSAERYLDESVERVYDAIDTTPEDCHKELYESIAALVKAVSELAVIHGHDSRIYIEQLRQDGEL